MDKFTDVLEERKSATIDGIFKSVTKAEELKNTDEPEVQARLKILNSHIEQIERLSGSV